MIIDWFTVGAQALNFFILVWLMKRYLYRPILDAIDAREKKVAAQLADAKTKKAEALKDRDDLQHKTDEFDRERATMMTKATDEAKAEQKRLMAAAQSAADGLSSAREAELKSDALTLDKNLSLRVQQQVFGIARKALTDLADTELEERLVEVLVRRLQSLDGPAKATLGKAIQSETGPSVVRSAFDLPVPQRAAIQKALNAAFSSVVLVRFETASSLVSGIEFVANGQKVAWTISDYLDSMETSVGDLLAKPDNPRPLPASKSKPKPKAEREPAHTVAAVAK